ncbi:MAG: Protein translation factor [Promethearchaeota archaeon]|nr:MAG: Protein translation factor [Candidatus Lokiarchaeota archaeon]
MEDKENTICNLCGLPKELCVCSDLSADEQEVVISNETRKWGKVVSVVTFQGRMDANLESLLTKAKKKLGAGGTIRGSNKLELRGDHRFRIKKFLIEQGYDKDRIKIR